MLDYRTHTFLTVCRLGSFTQAAAELHITQPAVSQHIRQLEAHYGCALFHKGGRRGELTQAGAMLFRALETVENDETRLKAPAFWLHAHHLRLLDSPRTRPPYGKTSRRDGADERWQHAGACGRPGGRYY